MHNTKNTQHYKHTTELKFGFTAHELHNIKNYNYIRNLNI